jgi:hypothetical protein
MSWSRWRRLSVRPTLVCLLTISSLWLSGCRGSGTSASSDDGRTRINNLFHLYKAYTEQNKKGPPDEQALIDFGKKLTPEQRASYIIPEDIDGLFVSPRDKQKYVIRWGAKLEPTGPPKGIIWEAQGKGGTRFVALAMGYVEEYDETMAKDYIK